MARAAHAGAHRRRVRLGGQGTFAAIADIAREWHSMYRTFGDFYPFYLDEHSDRRCRRMHFAGSLLVIAFVIAAIAGRDPWWLIGASLCGYGCAWIGHFAFGKNRPATFRHPLYSFMGDWMMFADILRGRVRL